MDLEITDLDTERAEKFLLSDLRKCALLLDIDGTILDLAPAPQEVWVPTELRNTLSRLEDLTGGALALVSGRSLHDIDLIFSPVLKRKLAALTELGPGILVEDKDYSLALHYRLAPDKGEVLRATIQEICASAPRGSIEILPGKLVFEIKMTGINKASAVRELMTYPPFKGRTPIFVGDDTTDEPVFPMLSQFGGLGFSVGRVVPDVNGHFENPKSVRGWLARIANQRQSTQNQGAAP